MTQSPVVIRYQWDEAELREAYRSLYNTPEKRIARAAAYVVGTFLILIGIKYWAGGTSVSIGFLWFVLGIFWICLPPIQWRVQLIRHLAGAFGSGDSGPVEWQITEQGWESTKGESHDRFHWMAFQKAVQCPSGLMLFMTKGMFLWIPRRALEKEDYNAVLLKAREAVPEYCAAGVPADEVPVLNIKPPVLEEETGNGESSLVARYEWAADERMEAIWCKRRHQFPLANRASGAFVFLLFALTHYSGPTYDPNWIWFALMGFALLFFNTLWYRWPWSIGRIIARQRFAQRPDNCVMIEWTITAPMLRKRSPLEERTFLWKSISKALRSSKGVVLLGEDGEFHWLPRTAFADEETYRKFLALAKNSVTKFVEVGIPIEERIAK